MINNFAPVRLFIFGLCCICLYLGLKPEKRLWRLPFRSQIVQNFLCLAKLRTERDVSLVWWFSFLTPQRKILFFICARFRDAKHHFLIFAKGIFSDCLKFAEQTPLGIFSSSIPLSLCFYFASKFSKFRRLPTAEKAACVQPITSCQPLWLQCFSKLFYFVSQLRNCVSVLSWLPTAVVLVQYFIN